jgi:hypothetical protein
MTELLQFALKPNIILPSTAVAVAVAVAMLLLVVAVAGLNLQAGDAGFFSLQ